MITVPSNWDYFYLGGSPNAEDCQPAGTGNYNPALAKLECQMLRDQLIETYGQPPEGVQFKITTKNSSYGSWELLVLYNTLSDDAADYALRCEVLPEKWSESAKRGLKEAGHPDFQD